MPWLNASRETALTSTPCAPRVAFGTPTTGSVVLASRTMSAPGSRSSVSKDEIYAELAIDFQLDLLTQLQQIDPQLPVLERFRLFLDLALQAHLSKRELHRVFLYCSRDEYRSRLPAKVAMRLQRVDQQVAEPSHALVIQGIEQGIFPARPVPLMMFGAQASFWGAIQLIWSGYLGEIDRQAYLDDLSDFILAGLTRDLTQGSDKPAD